jgi:hypothetical protein
VGGKERAGERKRDRKRGRKRNKTRQDKTRDLNRIEGVSFIAIAVITITIITTSAHAWVFFLLNILALEVLAGLLLGLASVHLGAARSYLLRILSYVTVIQYFALACNFLIFSRDKHMYGDILRIMLSMSRTNRLCRSKLEETDKSRPLS